MEISSNAPTAAKSGAALALDLLALTEGDQRPSRHCRLPNLNVSVKEVSLVGLHMFYTCDENISHFSLPQRNSQPQMPS